MAWLLSHADVLGAPVPNQARALLIAAATGWWLSACDDPPSDARGYAEAAQGGDPARCATLSDPRLAGECAAFAARELALAGDASGARAACGQVDPGLWREECNFLVCDALELSGASAISCCRDAGRWTQQCVGHAINRDAAALFATAEVGAERRLHADLEKLVAGYIDGPEVQAKARRVLVSRLALRAPGAPLSAQVCGDAPHAVCRDVYAERVKLAAKDVDGATQPWRAACGETVSAQRAAAAGLPVWAPEMDEIAADAWRQLCRR